MSDAADGPRSRAWRLLTARQPRGFIEERSSAAGADLDPRDAGLLRQLAIGVTRHRATLDAVCERISGRRARGQDAKIWTAVRLGAFQLLFLARVPDHAAVGESVALAPTRARGFVNGVLRNVARGVVERRPAGSGVSDARRAVPLPAGGTVVLDRDVFPDPGTHPDRWLAAAYSYPTWFVRRRLDVCGFDGARRVCVAGNAPAPLTLRPNPLRATATQVAAREAAGEALVAVAEGWACVQDATSQTVAPMLAPTPGERVLDLCAAPGGKTLHLAELMGNAGHIVAVDPSAEGCARLREQASRAGVDIVETQVGDGRTVALERDHFDAVLVDAPCSNTGVLRRRAEARWRARPDALGGLTALQQALLRRAARVVRPGGRIVYSVCSIEPEEGPAAVRGDAVASLTLVAERVDWPGSADGGYAAAFVRG